MKKSTNLLFFCLSIVVGVILDLVPIQVPDGIDKFYHLIGFSLITILAISTHVSFFGRKHINDFLLFLLASGGVFAGVAEFIQNFTVVRECSVQDWITNLCGITLIVVLAFLHYSKESKNIELTEEKFEFKDLPVV